MTNQELSSKAITYQRQGGYDVIEVAKRSVRIPGEGEVRIAVAAAAVNPTDILLRDPGYGAQAFPAVPGMDAAGVIETAGPGVSRLQAGQKVMAAVMPRRPDGGAQAQHIVVPAASVVAIPEGASMAEAATLPMNGLTALFALELAGLQPGQTLAVSGGAGLLAHYAIAIAKRQGLKTITDAKPEEFDLVAGYGADIVIKRGPDFSGAVRQEAPAGADALLDTALLGEQAFGAIRDDGIYVPVRGWADKPTERGIKVKPVFVSKVLERTDWLELLRDLVSTGEIKLRVAGEYTPEQIADAQKLLAAGGVRGRPVIVF
ncbi:quinone oxidoreductase family protein [Acidisoma silvae]|uniref:NADP-dependent oxidoreductase n=1 Tax=Acidisoma silvae TaxID=2802396 RepID=A0A963YWD0_9PROT|nr:NADP-dependent oxidoreductase [Acidisoma silvae]MCB8878095.1 NADP-dependent oxidoreductase [Acidisoma silvae]